MTPKNTLKTIRLLMIGGVIGLLLELALLSLSFATKTGLFAKIASVLVYPIYWFTCYYYYGSACQDVESMVLLVVGPIAGFFIGTLSVAIGKFIQHKFRKR